MKKVYQFLPGFSVGDAVSNYALDLSGILEDLGYASGIYSDYEHTSESLKDCCEPYTNYSRVAGADDILLYHYGVGSPVSQFLLHQPGKLVLIYHNITPAHFFEAIDRPRAEILNEGRTRLTLLKDRCSLALGVSEYNRIELQEMGFQHTAVLPLYLDVSRFNVEADKDVFNRNQGVFSIISVGRIAPNKRLEDTIRIFYFLRKSAYPLGRLFLIGSFGGMNKYQQHLDEFSRRLDLLPEVVFPGHVTDAKLKAYYQIASAYVCTSEHEGFCLPLLEAMYFNVPVFACDSAAIPETLGGSAVLLHDKRPEYIAEIITGVLQDKILVKQICASQQKRWQIFSKSHIATVLEKYLLSL
ncbi:MAG: glycosyltransferase [Chlamydiota bacterium]|nr:glycosyltransferase [Chlamydiota bacterium]